MSLAPNDKRSSPITGNTAKDGTGTEHRLVTDSSGFLKIVDSNTVTAVEDGTIPDGQTLPLEISILYAYYNSNLVRLQADSSGNLKVVTP